MAYVEITENKIVTLDSAGGYYNIVNDLYYCGNKSVQNNTINGNAGKLTIKAYVDPAITWITDIEVCTDNSGNENDVRIIDIVYTKNDTGSERSCNLKLNGMLSSAHYIILKQPNYIETTPSKVTVKVNLTISISDFNSNTPITNTGEITFVVYKTSACNEYGSNIVNYSNLLNVESKSLNLDYNEAYDYFTFNIRDISLEKLTGVVNNSFVSAVGYSVDMGLSSTSMHSIYVTNEGKCVYNSDSDTASFGITHDTRRLSSDMGSLKFTANSEIYIRITLSLG